MDSARQMINKYAQAATNLYGVLSVGEFVEIVNHYENSSFKVAPVVKMLNACSGDLGVVYVLDSGWLIGPALGAELGDYEDDVQSVRAAQDGKMRYLPSKDEFLKYEDEGYVEPAEPYEVLERYLENKPHTNYDPPLRFVEDALFWVRYQIGDGVPMLEIINQMTHAGLTFKNDKEFESFVSIMTNVWNNTRVFANNGFTPNESGVGRR